VLSPLNEKICHYYFCVLGPLELDPIPKRRVTNQKEELPSLNSNLNLIHYEKKNSTTKLSLIANQTTSWIYHPPWGKKALSIQPQTYF
jgi:hypothetical protein